MVQCPDLRFSSSYFSRWLCSMQFDHMWSRESIARVNLQNYFIATNFSSPFITMATSFPTLISGANKLTNGKEIARPALGGGISKFHSATTKVTLQQYITGERILLKMRNIKNILGSIHCSKLSCIELMSSTDTGVKELLFWCWKYITSVSEFLGDSSRAALKWNYIINGWWKMRGSGKVVKGHLSLETTRGFQRGVKNVAGWAA